VNRGYCASPACSKSSADGTASATSGATARAAAPGPSGLDHAQKKLIKAYLADGGDDGHGDPNSPFNQTEARKKLAVRCKGACAHVSDFGRVTDEFGMGAKVDNGAVVRDGCIEDCLRYDYTAAEIDCVAKAKDEPALRRCQLAAQVK
jgi:hypothetical protein